MPNPPLLHLEWPFFDAAHAALASDLAFWLDSNREAVSDANCGDADKALREVVRRLGAAGWLRFIAPQQHSDGATRLDVRTLCLIREALAYRSGLADLAFAMQGLGSAPISLFGSSELIARYVSQTAAGTRVAAFAISEPDAGSDLASMSTTAQRIDDRWAINGCKTWISNAGVADYYVVFTRDDSAGDSRASAFVVDSNVAGLAVEPLRVSARHPIGTLTFDGVVVPETHLLGAPGDGLKIALTTLDFFRSSVGAAAIGFARRALDEALDWVKRRRVSDGLLSDQQITQARIADMALAVDAAALLVYRAAWITDTLGRRVTREAAMAKMYATESAQQVIDAAVQLLGARGVVAGSPLEELYREIRALRIYEGTTEIQKMIIARSILG